MDSDLAQKAVAAAIRGNWKEAIAVNKEVLKISPSDIDALNRLAKAYCESGYVTRARQISKKALKVDPVNSIALKSLDKWKALKSGTKHTANQIPGEIFLEEPGKTKLAPLLHPGPANILALIDAGDEVKLSPHAHRVNVVTNENQYVGRLADDLAARLRHLLSLGYRYKVHIMSVEQGNVLVFIRELTRNENSINTPSFPLERVGYADSELLSK